MLLYKNRAIYQFRCGEPITNCIFIFIWYQYDIENLYHYNMNFYIALRYHYNIFMIFERDIV